jgi:DNA-binding IclR family transcriptional regulator
MTADAFAVGRTLQAIEVLSFQPASAPPLAGALRIHPRTARRLLNRLVADGWLTRSAGRERTYAPTMRIVAVAAQLAETAPLTRRAVPVVERLHAETGLAAHLAVPCYRSVLCLVHRGGGRDLPPGLRELMPADATAAGKALLAHRAAWRAEVLGQARDIDAARLERDLAAVRERGWAAEDGEHAPGVAAVAAPVFAAGGDVDAALAVTGPARRVGGGRQRALVALVTAAAEELGGLLGATGRG